MTSSRIQKLIELFSKFPTIGPKTAARFVFYLIRLRKEEIGEITDAISEIKKNIKICHFCFNPFEPSDSTHAKSAGELCQICSNPGRNKSMLCVVEKESDLEAVEKTKKYNGRYFILGGTVSRLKKAEIEKLRVKDLEAKAKYNEEIREIILAINPTPEGEATTLYLERLLKPYGKKITRLGLGLPVGGELEYADEETLSSAIEGRK
jgi:recombination protein RecR